MSGVNKVIIIGNLGRDPEVNGPATKLSVATTRKYKTKDGEQREETEWHRVVCFGKTGENAAKYLSKGRQVYVEGRIKTSSYEKDGEKRHSTEIVADTVQFLGGKGEGNSGPAPYDPGKFGTPPSDDGIPF